MWVDERTKCKKGSPLLDTVSNELNSVVGCPEGIVKFRGNFMIWFVGILGMILLQPLPVIPTPSIFAQPEDLKTVEGLRIGTHGWKRGLTIGVVREEMELAESSGSITVSQEHFSESRLTFRKGHAV